MNQAIGEKAVKAALAKAAELGTSMSVAVVDESGTLVYFVKGDATGLHTFETARVARWEHLGFSGAPPKLWSLQD